MGSLAPWLLLEALLFVGGVVVLWFLSRRGPLRPLVWWPAPALMAGVGLAMALLRESRVQIVLDGAPYAERATVARLWHAQTANDVWLVLILLVAWCLGGAWSHGRVRTDGPRLVVGGLLAGLAAVSGEWRLGISAAALLASALAPGALGMAGGLLAATSGFAAHLGWLGRALAGAEPAMIALAGPLAWGFAAVAQSGAALRSEHSTGFGIGWGLGVGALATWLATAREAQAPWAPAPLTALAELGVEAPEHRPSRIARLRHEDCVWHRTPQQEGWTRLSGGLTCRAPDVGAKHFVVVARDRPLADVVAWGPGEWRIVVEAHDGTLPGDLDRWRWSWEPVRVVAEGSQFRPGAHAVRIAWRDGVPVLPGHGAAPVDDASLADALADAPVRVDLLAEPDEHVTVEEWLALCREARSHRRFVRCGAHGAGLLAAGRPSRRR